MGSGPDGARARSAMRRKRVLAILNPAAGGAAAARLGPALVAAARRRGLALTLRLSAAPGEASEIARTCAARFDGVLALGGDGTVQAVAAGLLALPAAARTPLGIVPAGSGNDLARALGLRADPRQAIALLERAAVRRLDVIEVAGRPCLNNLGFGFSAAVVHERARWRRARRWLGGGHFGYALFGLWALGHAAAPLTIELPDRLLRGSFFEVELANGPWCGGGVSFVPGADPFDGVLDLVLIEPRPLFQTLRLLRRAQRGGPIEGVGIERVRLESVRFASERGLRWHADGEPHCAEQTVQLHCRLLRAALPVLVPLEDGVPRG